MTTPRRVNYNGADLTLRELSEAVGISLSCLDARYRKGDRGEKLWRSLDCVGGKTVGRPASSLRGEGVSANAREREAARRAQQFARKEERAARIAALKAEYAADLSRPLIDSKLLRPKERAAIQQRVKNCGQLNWRSDGGSVL